ncbi:MAG: tRNA1(Val) (adenine(37)-N6)-methyltransferase [Eubacteriales bacterium]|nr:tRNA1(Val) (adenine(37)-N6)-methyltransferase [Eubacteriales bacterium]
MSLRIDDLNIKGYRVIQNTDAFCFGMDAVLLSDFAKVKKGETAIDLGTGTGIIPILLEAKTEGSHFTGVEIQEEMAELARQSVELNGLSEKIDIINADLRSLQENEDIKKKGLNEDGTQGQVLFDVVTSNPPYMRANNGEHSPSDTKAIARHEVMCSLNDVCECASRLLKTGGRFYLVHRPLRTPEIIEALKKSRLEPKRMRFVHPFKDKEANMVLIEAVKNARPECRIEAPLIVYETPGVYTEEIHRIYESH